MKEFKEMEAVSKVNQIRDPKKRNIAKVISVLQTLISSQLIFQTAKQAGSFWYFSWCPNSNNGRRRTQLISTLYKLVPAVAAITNLHHPTRSQQSLCPKIAGGLPFWGLLHR
ncbi:hypothetical protein CEXT_453281 [Caerostris extrusa]|uniref:Uncharacterized protein n=1 Tax=Caerostris extrusa TaxID=172846 RepID=A0AAV4MSJ4_CAEEX|nr:hypothetical protein CEXT_453281 [Caerostris extrusa]